MQEAFNNSESVEIDQGAINSWDLAWNKPELSWWRYVARDQLQIMTAKRRGNRWACCFASRWILRLCFLCFLRPISLVINEKQFPPLNFKSRISKFTKRKYILFVSLIELVLKWSKQNMYYQRKWQISSLQKLWTLTKVLIKSVGWFWETYQGVILEQQSEDDPENTARQHQIFKRNRYDDNLLFMS